jgi:hypothetical protein
MSDRPQVLTLSTGNAEATLDTATVARALFSIALARPWMHKDDVQALVTTLTTLCSPAHLHAVLHLTTTPEHPTHAR